MSTDFANEIPSMKSTFVLHKNLWSDFKSIHDHIIKGTWNEVKFLDDGKLHDDMDKLPKDKGGIYAFYTKPNVMGNQDGYLLYIGRARFTNTHNLWKRCRRYVNAEKSRPKVERMVDTYGDQLYIKYISIGSNKIIESVEDELIDCLLPPCNDKIPNKLYGRKIKAF